jgi:hypothetical protein
MNSVFQLSKDNLMVYTQIERLKRDEKEALHYCNKLLRKGNDVLAYKIQKKADYIAQSITEMQMIK